MKSGAKHIRDQVDELEAKLKGAKRNLIDLVRTCSHQYGDTVYDPIYIPAYTFPGDKPGTMGVDFRGPVHVPAGTKSRWKRECEYCGDVEYTTKVQKEIKEKPDWGNRK